MPNDPTYPEGTALDCLPTEDDPTEASYPLAGKLKVLNCLVFDTPHNFWKAQLRTTISNNSLASSRRYTWLGYGDWECTLVPDGPLSACLKHDVAYGSLQKFVGTDDADELDSPWNPRNKHLADAQFHTDIAKYGCDNPNRDYWDREWCNLFANGNENAEGSLANRAGTWALANVKHWGVNKINSKGWPFTEQDLAHIGDSSSWGFVECGVPTANSVVVTGQGNVAAARWTDVRGCVRNITIDHYRLCWEYEGTRTRPRGGSYPVTDIKCTKHQGDDSQPATFKVSDELRNWTSVTLKTVEIKPNNVVYGGPFGFETLLGNPFFDEVLGGTYYPAIAITRNNTFINSQ